jgi:hypothetical protein
LDAPLSKLCPVIPTSNQDGHQAKNRKRGDEILIVHCCYLPGTIPARFGLIWFSSFRGEDLNVIFYQNMPNLHNRNISTERKILKLLSQSQTNFAEMILGWTSSKIVSGDPDFQPRWPPC